MPWASVLKTKKKNKDIDNISNIDSCNSSLQEYKINRNMFLIWKILITSFWYKLYMCDNSDYSQHRYLKKKSFYCYIAYFYQNLSERSPTLGGIEERNKQTYARKKKYREQWFRSPTYAWFRTAYSHCLLCVTQTKWENLFPFGTRWRQLTSRILS